MQANELCRLVSQASHSKRDKSPEDIAAIKRLWKLASTSRGPVHPERSDLARVRELLKSQDSAAPAADAENGDGGSKPKAGAQGAGKGKARRGKQAKAKTPPKPEGNESTAESAEDGESS